MTPFNTEETICLEDDRILMRPLELGDLQHLLPFAINEPDLWEFSLQSAGGEENMRTYLQSALNKRKERDSYPFIVFDKATNSYVGSTRFYDIQPQNDSLQLGFTWYGKLSQRTGINRRCKFLMLKFAFEELGMHRVEFRADAKNTKSIQAMKAIGCVEEGVLRQNVPTPAGERRDSIILSILKSEWDSTIKDALSKLIRKP